MARGINDKGSGWYHSTRALTREFGMECPVPECDVIIQPDTGGNLPRGVSMHMGICHPGEPNFSDR